MNVLEIITTSDGSHTLFNKDLNETYHSVHGALQESLHVFIKNGLEYFSKDHPPKIISILEVGFGTGLNALLSWQYAMANNLQIIYTSLEPFPLEEEVWSKLNYAASGSEKDRFRTLHECVWGQEVSLAREFSLLKVRSSLLEMRFAKQYDVIFFDAFAPSVQPELWEYATLKKVADTLKSDGVFVTYSAKGQLKRDLRTFGLLVETLPGPPGKKEMVRGVNAGG